MDLIMHDIVFLLAVPRSGSTATELAFKHSGLFSTFMHEPNSDRYYKKHNNNLPGMKTEHMKFLSYPEFKAQVLAAAEGGRVFVKDMVHHFYDEITQDEAFCKQIKFALLIRDPLPAIRSHLSENYSASSEEIGFEALAKFSNQLKTWKQPYRVIDYQDIVNDPDQALDTLIEALGLPPRSDSFEIKPDSEMKSQMAKFASWHEVALNSTKIETKETVYKVKAEDPRVQELLKHHQPYYDQLRAEALCFAPKVPALQLWRLSLSSPQTSFIPIDPLVSPKSSANIT
jgi:hypothetical protein